MRIARAYSQLCFILIILFAPGCKTHYPEDGEQDLYSFTAETIGYSKIKRLYTPDTGAIKPSFFDKEDLQVLEMNMGSEIRVTVMRKDGKESLLGFEILNPSVSITNNTFPLSSERIEKELSHPFFSKVAEDGKIVAVRTDTAISDMVSSLQKEILGRFQFVKPSGAGQTWETLEENTTGTFKAKYETMPVEDSQLVFTKSNLGYTALKSGRQGQSVHSDNHTQYSLDTLGKLQRINISEAQVTLINKDTVSAIGAKITVVHKSSGKSASGGMATLKKLERSSNYSNATTLSAAMSEEEIFRQAYRGTLRNDDWESLLQKLDKLDNAGEGVEDSLVLQFRALAWLNPAYCEKIGSLLRDEPIHSRTFRVLSRSLYMTETASAIDAIAVLVSERRKEEKTMLELLPVLATSKFPTDKAMQVTKELITDPQASPVTVSTAELTLGGLAHNFRDSDLKKSEEITSYLLNRMDKEKDTLQRILVLGNTGSPSILPLLQSYIQNASVSGSFRKEAVLAIRMIDNVNADKLLEQLVNNKDTSLAKAAKEVIAYRKKYSDQSP